MDECSNSRERFKESETLFFPDESFRPLTFPILSSAPLQFSAALSPFSSTNSPPSPHLCFIRSTLLLPSSSSLVYHTPHPCVLFTESRHALTQKAGNLCSHRLSLPRTHCFHSVLVVLSMKRSVFPLPLLLQRAPFLRVSSSIPLDCTTHAAATAFLFTRSSSGQPLPLLASSDRSECLATPRPFSFLLLREFSVFLSRSSSSGGAAAVERRWTTRVLQYIRLSFRYLLYLFSSSFRVAARVRVRQCADSHWTRLFFIEATREERMDCLERSCCTFAASSFLLSVAPSFLRVTNSSVICQEETG